MSMTMKVQESERLRYELMTRDDAALFFQLDQDVEVMRYINGGKMTTMEEVNTIYVPRMESYRNASKGWGIWKVSVKETDSFIGWILVRPMGFFSEEPELDNLELGWRFMRYAWGKGYATEAATSIKDALIARGEINVLSAIAIEENHSSINIMRKLGMKYIKTDIQHDPLGDQEVVYYQLNLHLGIS